MKKLFMIILAMTFMFSVIWAGQIKVKKTTIIRSAVMAKDNVGVAKPGQIFEVLEEIGSWHYIEITSGSDHVGQKGWVWYKLIDGKKIIGDKSVDGFPGVVLHSKPSTKSSAVCKVKSSATYKLIKIDVKWYKIGDGKYIYYYNTIKI